jgi:hypothetical protein
LKYLTETRGYTAEQTSPGIYRISGDYLPIQIIESGKLSERENIWLKSLTNGLRTSNAAGIIEEVDKCGNKASLGAYLDVLMRANTEAFKEAKTMARRGLPTLEEALEEIGILPEMIERCERRGMEQGLAKGMEQGLEQGMEQGLEQGMEQGMEKGLKTAARNALVKGLPIDVIRDITGLDIDTIKQIAI